MAFYVFYVGIRYTNPKDVEVLEECAVLDPRFKTMAWLSEAERNYAYDRVKDKIVAVLDEVEGEHCSTQDQEQSSGSISNAHRLTAAENA